MFSLNNSINTVVAHAEGFNLIQQSILRAIEEHGGSVETLNRLLEDATGERKLVGDIAKLVVGPLWTYTERLVDLGVIDFDQPAEELYALYPGIVIAGAVREDQHTSLSFTKPEGRCLYRLAHLGPQRLLFDEVLDVRLGEQVERAPRVEHAGWRELIVFAALLRPNDFRNCRINAAGSLCRNRKLDGSIAETTIMPTMVEHQDKTTMVWSGVKRRGTDRNFGPEAFYLVRVYE